MVMNLDSVRGIYSALVTPMDQNEQIDHVVLWYLLEFQLAMGVEGLYCCGFAGEALLLSLEEREAVVQTVIYQVSGRVPVIAHVGMIRTADTDSMPSDSQTAYACALYQHLVEGELSQKVGDRLVEQVWKADYHLDMGILGTKYFFAALSSIGYGDTAYQIVTNPTYLGGAYEVARESMTRH